MVVFAGFTGCDGEFFDACQATVRPGDPSASGLAAPERQEIQSWHGKIFSTPGDVDTDDVDLSSREFGKTGNRVKKMLEPADVGRRGIVLPAMNVNEKQGTLRLMDRFQSNFSL